MPASNSPPPVPPAVTLPPAIPPPIEPPAPAVPASLRVVEPPPAPPTRTEVAPHESVNTRSTGSARIEVRSVAHLGSPNLSHDGHAARPLHRRSERRPSADLAVAACTSAERLPVRSLLPSATTRGRRRLWLSAGVGAAVREARPALHEHERVGTTSGSSAWHPSGWRGSWRCMRMRGRTGVHQASRHSKTQTPSMQTSTALRIRFLGTALAYSHTCSRAPERIEPKRPSPGSPTRSLVLSFGAKSFPPTCRSRFGDETRTSATRATST